MQLNIAVVKEKHLISSETIDFKFRRSPLVWLQNFEERLLMCVYEKKLHISDVKKISEL